MHFLHQVRPLRALLPQRRLNPAPSALDVLASDVEGRTTSVGYNVGVICMVPLVRTSSGFAPSGAWQ